MPYKKGGHKRQNISPSRRSPAKQPRLETSQASSSILESQQPSGASHVNLGDLPIPVLPPRSAPDVSAVSEATTRRCAELFTGCREYWSMPWVRGKADSIIHSLLSGKRIEATGELNRYYIRLPDAVQTVVISAFIKSFAGVDARPLQAQAIAHLLRGILFYRTTGKRRIDANLLFTVRTSYGKSLIFQTLPLLIHQSIVLVILPLNRIGFEQEVVIGKKFSKLRGVRAIFINGDNSNNTSIMSQVAKGQFTHVFISPELALKTRFLKVIAEPTFQSRTAAVCIDEIHLVKQWGTKFRTQFARLHMLRQRLGLDVVLFGCTATLDPVMKDHIIEAAGFDNLTHIRGSINRASIMLFVRQLLPGDITNFASLWFTIAGCVNEEGVVSFSDIRKTVIFMDNKPKAQLCAQTIRLWLRRYTKLGATSCDNVVQVYHANIAKSDQDLIYTDFKNPHSVTRIVVATESLGLGVDLDGVQDVIIWGLPEDLSFTVINQRVGRAARALGEKGRAIWFVQSWCVGPRGHDIPTNSVRIANTIDQDTSTTEQDTLPASSSAQVLGEADVSLLDAELEEEIITDNTCELAKVVKATTASKRRDQLPYEIWAYINANLVPPRPRTAEEISHSFPSVRPSCRRRPQFDFFEEHLSDIDSREELPRLEGCCDLCAISAGVNVDEMFPSRPEEFGNARKAVKLAKSNFRARAVLTILLQWAAAITSADLESENSIFNAPICAFLREEKLYSVCRNWRTKLSVSVFWNQIGTWEHKSVYGSSLYTLYTEACEEVRADYKLVIDDRRLANPIRTRNRPTMPTSSQMGFPAPVRMNPTSNLQGTQIPGPTSPTPALTASQSQSVPIGSQSQTIIPLSQAATATPRRRRADTARTPQTPINPLVVSGLTRSPGQRINLRSSQRSGAGQNRRLALQRQQFDSQY